VEVRESFVRSQDGLTILISRCLACARTLSVCLVLYLSRALYCSRVHALPHPSCLSHHSDLFSFSLFMSQSLCHPFSVSMSLFVSLPPLLAYTHTHTQPRTPPHTQIDRNAYTYPPTHSNTHTCFAHLQQSHVEVTPTNTHTCGKLISKCHWHQAQTLTLTQTHTHTHTHLRQCHLEVPPTNTHTKHTCTDSLTHVHHTYNTRTYRRQKLYVQIILYMSVYRVEKECVSICECCVCV